MTHRSLSLLAFYDPSLGERVRALGVDRRKRSKSRCNGLHAGYWSAWVRFVLIDANAFEIAVETVFMLATAPKAINAATRAYSIRS